MKSSNLKTTQAEEYERLLQWFHEYNSVVVAFSGGVDSTLVLKAAIDSIGAENVLAATADSPSLPRSELDELKLFVEEFDVQHWLLSTDELDNPLYTSNMGLRCYYCKGTFYQLLRSEVESRLAAPDSFALKDPYVLVDGTNLDDLSDDRPGQRAADEAGIKHPLIETEIDKRLVRELSQMVGLRSWDKPEMACLASRIPLGSKVTEKKLSMVEAAEQKLGDLGFKKFRVRYHELSQSKPSSPQETNEPITLARIEFDDTEVFRTADAQLRAKIAEAVKSVGFSFVAQDLEGYRKGGVPRNKK